MKNKNYTKEQENQIRELSPITYDIAVELGENFGKTLRSVIAKACSMDGVEYIARERVNKNGKPTVSKAEIVESIREYLPGLQYQTVASGSVVLEGLEKAPKTSLLEILEALQNGLTKDINPNNIQYVLTKKDETRVVTDLEAEFARGES